MKKVVEKVTLYGRLEKYHPFFGLIIQFVFQYPYELIISAILLMLFIANYTVGTFLTGWDNLHTEFNYWLNIKRSLITTWQEYQGLGLLAGMGHGANLVREVFLLILSPFLPMSFVRYFYHFLMMATGTFGMYFLLKKVFLEGRPGWGPFLGALFYLLNFGSVQYFHVPFEPYSTAWGLFPWATLSFFLYLRKPDIRTVGLFAFINLFITPQALVQTVALVYSMVLGIFSIGYFALHRTKKTLFRVLTAMGIVLAVNSFWLLPNIYFAATDIAVTQNAMQNRIVTDRFFEMSKNRGNLLDFALLRQLYYDVEEYEHSKDAIGFLMQTWRDYQGNTAVVVVGILLFITAVTGFFVSKHGRVFLLPVFVLSMTVFLSATPGISLLNDLFREIPVVNQIFRNPFTKFITPTVAVLSIGFAFGSVFIVEQLTRHIKTPQPAYIAPAVTGIFTLLLVIVSYPSFTGNYISPTMRVSIPPEYFQLFDYFREQDKDARIMNLPQHEYWGWYRYSWGAKGSGFLWYGIEQPILDRAFDVWSDELEGYFWEVSAALKSGKVDRFNEVIAKYDIDFIIFDKNLIYSETAIPHTFLLDQKRMLENNPAVRHAVTYGDITVYRTNLSEQSKSFVTPYNYLPKIYSPEQYMHQDPMFAKYGSYIRSVMQDADIVYPFGSLFSFRFQDEIPFRASIKDDEVTVETVAQLTGRYEIKTVDTKDSLLPTSVSAQLVGDNLEVTVQTYPFSLSIGDFNISTEVRNTSLSIPVGTASSFLLAFNEETILPISTAEARMGYATDLYVRPGVNTIRLYDADERTSRKLDISAFEAPRICGLNNPDAVVYGESTDTKLSIIGRNTGICSRYGAATFDIQKDTLLGVSFYYESYTDEKPSYCLFSYNRGTCINNKDALPWQFSSNKTMFTDFSVINEDVDGVFFDLILEATNSSTSRDNKKITYSDVTLSSYELLGSKTLRIEPYKFTQGNNIVNLSGETVVSVRSPVLKAKESITNIYENNTYSRTAFDLNPRSQGSISLEQQSNGTLRATGQNAGSFIEFRNGYADPRYGSIGVLRTANIEGFPFFVSMRTIDRSMPYTGTYLWQDSASEFIDNIFVFPPVAVDRPGTVYLLESRSFNNTMSINDLIGLKVVPFPVDAVSGLHFVKNNLEEANPPGLPEAVIKHSYTFYSVVPGDSDVGFVVLNQSFDKGWRAFTVADTQGWLVDTALGRLIAPFVLQGQAIEEHVKVNGWANGWKLPGAADRTGQEVILVFLPQYIQYIGLFVTVTTLLVIGVMYMRSAKRYYTQLPQEFFKKKSALISPLTNYRTYNYK
ncbi:MAG: hypothetical protein N2691_02665 [Patescibacteria group bacterium]|nr:hypothetical protein [Patescibacteria group bacterium]